MLTDIWLVPVVGGILVAFLPAHFGKWVAALTAALALVVAGYAAYAFDPATHGYQFVEQVHWIPQLKADYYLGVDSVSVWLVVLNALIGLIAVLATPALRQVRTSRFLALLLVMEGGMAGVFLSVDLVLFYFFWEAMLIPAYFLLWMWGEGPRPLFAALKFVLFTLAGSLLMLVGIIGEFVFTGSASFNLPDLAKHQASPEIQFGLFFLFAVAFVVKIPVFPFHGWLPDAYLAAPTPMLLALRRSDGKDRRLRDAPNPHPALPRPDLALELERRDAGAGGAGDHLGRADGARPARHEAAGRLLQRQPHGLHRAGHLRLQRPGPAGRRPPDGQPRPDRPGPLPAGRLDPAADRDPRPHRPLRPRARGCRSWRESSWW